MVGRVVETGEISLYEIVHFLITFPIITLYITYDSKGMGIVYIADCRAERSHLHINEIEWIVTLSNLDVKT